MKRLFLSILLLLSQLATAGSYWTLPEEMRGDSTFTGTLTSSGGGIDGVLSGTPIWTDTQTYRWGAETLSLGADFNSSSLTDATRKYSNVTTRPYTNSEENVSIFHTETDTAFNLMRIGGGDSGYNAMTQIRFYLGASAITTTGTEVMRLDDDAINVYQPVTFSGGFANQTISGAVTWSGAQTLTTTSVHNGGLRITRSGTSSFGALQNNATFSMDSTTADRLNLYLWGNDPAASQDKGEFLIGGSNSAGGSADTYALFTSTDVALSKPVTFSGGFANQTISGAVTWSGAHFFSSTPAAGAYILRSSNNEAAPDSADKVARLEYDTTPAGNGSSFIDFITGGSIRGAVSFYDSNSIMISGGGNGLAIGDSSKNLLAKFTASTITLNQPVTVNTGTTDHLLAEANLTSGAMLLRATGSYSGGIGTRYSTGGIVMSTNGHSDSISSDSWKGTTTGAGLGSAAIWLGRATVLNAFELRAKTTASTTAAAFATYFDTPIITATYAGAVTLGPSTATGTTLTNNGYAQLGEAVDGGGTTPAFAVLKCTNSSLDGTSPDTLCAHGLSKARIKSVTGWCQDVPTNKIYGPMYFDSVLKFHFYADDTNVYVSYGTQFGSGDDCEAYIFYEAS